jgi:hypothetical protein
MRTAGQMAPAFFFVEQHDPDKPCAPRVQLVTRR